jgi:hypothetical protein
MVQLWYMVVPMFRCWNVLLPLKMMAGYEAVLVSLEKRAMCPLRRSRPWRRTSIIDAGESNGAYVAGAPDVAVGVG